MSGSARERGYHHGDLRAGLVGAAIELIEERGSRDFSIAEAARRLGVSSGAPYRHFADKQSLLAAVAARAAEMLRQLIDAEAGDVDDALARLQAGARAYLRFAADHPMLFSVLYASGLDKRSHAELREATRTTAERYLEPARALGVPEPERLGEAVAAVAHGYAGLVLDGAPAREAGEALNRAVAALASGWPTSG